MKKMGKLVLIDIREEDQDEEWMDQFLDAVNAANQSVDKKPEDKEEK